VEGDVAAPLSLTFDQIRRMPKAIAADTIH
jgi:hypothetical protein